MAEPTVAGVHLQRTDENVSEISALVDALGRFPGGGRVGVAGVLADLDRRARRTWAPGLAVTRALKWDRADVRDPAWWPQGISNSLRTSVVRDVLAVSWYSKRGEGVRVSFLDLATRRYRHVLLVRPRVEDGRARTEPVRVHAGGLVWHGDYLHIAATGRGFLTCRLDDVLRVPDALRDSSDLPTYGYRYVLPVRFSYKAYADEGFPKLRYSFLSLDRSTEPPTLVAGEYGSRRQTRRIARFPTSPSTGLLDAADDGLSRPLALDEGGAERMQGVTVVDGTYYVTASHGPWVPGSLHVGRPGAFRARRLATPPGPEDMVWWATTDRLWTVTEHPWRRWVVEMRRPSAA